MMTNRIASPLSSLAVADLAWTLTADFWRARDSDLHHSRALLPSTPSCWCLPASRCNTERDGIA
jgi:hypothetical protein